MTDASSFNSNQASITSSPSSSQISEPVHEKVSYVYTTVKWGGTAIWGLAFTASIVVFILSKALDKRDYVAWGTVIMFSAFFFLILWGGVMALLKRSQDPCC